MKNQNSISEFGLIGLKKDEEYLKNYKFKSVFVEDTVYKELEEFAKTDKGKDILGFSGNGRFLQAKNYVGVIQTISGYTLEILPKIYGENNEENSKKIFLNLLKILYKLPNYKHINSAKFDTENKPVLEIFITMFLVEIGIIIKKGIKSDYLPKQDNEHFLKGKLLVKEHIKKNYIHKERFYVEYDEYTQNRVENRLIKSTLKFLLQLSSSFENIRLIRMYLEYMHYIDFSFNYDSDFKRCDTKTRGMGSYRDALIWAKVFLEKETFGSFSGETIAFALLYPMEKLFENYVEYYLKNRYRKLNIAPQNKKEFIVGLFGIKPDFLIKKADKILVVADAKWKIIEEKNSFSQSDFYQLFAYSQIFKPKKSTLRLYYPMSKFLKKPILYEYSDDNKTKICVIPLDMKKIKDL